jgi:hypothetical protein
MEQTKPFQQRSKFYNHGLLDCLIHFKQPHNNMHGHLGLIQKFDNQNKNVTTTPRHLKIKTSKYYYCRCKIWQNKLAHCFVNHGTRRKVAICDWSLQLVLVTNNFNN